MKKEDKEKTIFQLELKEIERMEKENSAFLFKMLAGLLAIITFLYSSGILKNIPSLVYIFLTGMFIICWENIQTDKYISDYYRSFSKAVIENRILEYKFPDQKVKELFWYKTKYINS